MIRKVGIVAAVLLVGALVTSPATAAFTVDLWADIPADMPVVGLGIDVWFDSVMVGDVESVTFGPDWFELVAELDPDDATVGLDLAGIETFPPPIGVTGNVLLATIAFSGDGDALSLIVGDHNPWNGLGDLNEGFAAQSPVGSFLAPLGTTGGGVVTYADQTPGDTGIFTIGFVPEPATLSILALGALLVWRRR